LLVLQDMQLCGSFWMYSSLNIPIWDGGDCRWMETFVKIFGCFWVGLAAWLVYVAFCLKNFSLVACSLVFGALLFPFALYISIIAALVYLIGVVIVLVIIYCCGGSLADEDGKGDEESKNSLRRVRINEVSK